MGMFWNRTEAVSVPNGPELCTLKRLIWGRLGDSADLGSGHDLPVCGFEPREAVWADSSERGAASDSASPSVSAPPPLALCLSRSLNNKQTKLKQQCFCWVPFGKLINLSELPFDLLHGVAGSIREKYHACSSC